MDLTLLILDLISVVAAIAAAVFWLLSARVNTPNGFNVHVVKPDQGPMGGNPMGATYIGNAYSQDFKSLGDALKKQSRLSATGALLAATSAICQALSLVLKF